jgi:hypothetical protein
MSTTGAQFAVAGVRVEELIEPRFIRKLDESGFIEKVSAAYGGK